MRWADETVEYEVWVWRRRSPDDTWHPAHPIELFDREMCGFRPRLSERADAERAREKAEFADRDHAAWQGGRPPWETEFRVVECRVARRALEPTSTDAK